MYKVNKLQGYIAQHREKTLILGRTDGRRRRGDRR